MIRACVKCGAELDPAQGEWVPKFPKEPLHGYQLSQLFSDFVDPGDILHQFNTTNDLTNFYNLKLGLPYVLAVNRLDVAEVLALCGSEGIASSDKGPCYMGVDQGRDLHVVIGKRYPGRAGQIIHLGVYKDWEDLDLLMKRFNVARCIVDAMPELRNARAFAGRHRGKVFLCWYSETQQVAPVFNEEDLSVRVNRTETLDTSHMEILNGELILPRECDIVREFAQHLHNTAKKLEEDEETGSKRYVYVRLGADHYRHGQNYECLARRSSPELLFPEFASNAIF